MDEIKRCMNEAATFLDRDAGVCDEMGRVLATTRPILELNEMQAALKAPASDQVWTGDGRSFCRLDPDIPNSGIVFVSGTDRAAQDVLGLLVRWIRSTKLERNTRLERQNFLKNVLLENELPGDIPLKAREFKVSYALPRRALLIRFNEACDPETLKTVQNLIGEGEDEIFTVDEHNIVVLLVCSEEGERGDKISEELLSTFTESGRKIHIGVGLLAENLKDTAKSYREASLALTVGSIFYEDTKVMWYNRLGLGRLIYQLPPTLCRMFLSEVFAAETYEMLDPETLLTIEKFFENNLNGSETSRQLFVHRNTLVYRLDKVQKITGLDLRSFDDAVLFKLASMVRRYLESLNQAGETKSPEKRW